MASRQSPKPRFAAWGPLQTVALLGCRPRAEGRSSLKRVNVLQVELWPCRYILGADGEIEIEVYNVFLVDLPRQTGTEVKLFHQRVRDAHAVGTVIGELLLPESIYSRPNPLRNL